MEYHDKTRMQIWAESLDETGLIREADEVVRHYNKSSEVKMGWKIFRCKCGVVTNIETAEEKIKCPSCNKVVMVEE